MRDSLRAILATRPGEQLMRPDFGAGLDLLLHEPNTLATRRRDSRPGAGVARALGTAHRRSTASRSGRSPASRRQLRVEIAYRLVRTGAAASMALSMQLEG